MERQSMTGKEAVSADAVLDAMPLEAAWPPGMDIEKASEALARRMETQGRQIAGNLRAAFFEKIEEAVGAGKELTSEQQEFFEDEGRSRMSNPLYQKPKPR